MWRFVPHYKRRKVLLCSHNHRGIGVWRLLWRSASPTISLALPSPPLNHGPKGHMYRSFTSRVLLYFTTFMGTLFQLLTTLSGEEFFLTSILKIDKIIKTTNQLFMKEKSKKAHLPAHTTLRKGCVFSVTHCKGQLMPHVKTSSYRNILHSSYHLCQAEDWKILLGAQLKSIYQENCLLTL